MENRTRTRCLWILHNCSWRWGMVWVIVVLDNHRFIEPSNALELPLVDRIEADRATMPLGVIRSVNVVQYAWEAEYLASETMLSTILSSWPKKHTHMSTFGHARGSRRTQTYRTCCWSLLLSLCLSTSRGCKGRVTRYNDLQDILPLKIAMIILSAWCLPSEMRLQRRRTVGNNVKVVCSFKKGS